MTEVVSDERRLHELNIKLMRASNSEKAAKAERVAIEEEIKIATGFSKRAGSETFSTAGDWGSSKVTLKQPVSVTVIEDNVPAVKKALTRGQFSKVFKVKYSVVAKELDALEKSNRDLYLIVAEALRRKPGKVSVEIKLIEMAAVLPEKGS